MTKDGIGMNKVRCLKKNCIFNKANYCERGSILLIDSPLYPDLVRCDNFQERKGKTTIHCPVASTT